MQTYLITLGKGLGGPARMNGALVLGDNGLYFLCTGLGMTAGYDFSSFGPIGAQIEEYKKSGAQPQIDEATLGALVASTPNSFAIPSGKVESMSRSFCAGSKIVHDGGQKLVVWNPGFAGRFRDDAKQWAAGKNIKTEGL